MIDKANIEQFLKINGVTPTASDQEIKSMLLSARWDDEDVDTAMLVLRENTTTHESSVDSLHKVFRSDERLTPDSVSRLLGVQMDASDAVFNHMQSANTSSYRQVIVLLVVIIVTAALAIGVVVGAMWMLEVGPFHHSLLSV